MSEEFREEIKGVLMKHRGTRETRPEVINFVNIDARYGAIVDALDDPLMDATEGSVRDILMDYRGFQKDKTKAENYVDIDRASEGLLKDLIAKVKENSG